jgi:hypothetical protein
MLLISSDGFCYAYQYKVPLPHIRRLIAITGTGVHSSPPPTARDNKGVVAVTYFAAVSRLVRHDGRCPLECRV